MRALVGASMLLLSAGAGWAQSVPEYPVERWCDQVARSVGSRSEVIYGSCIDQEQGAYDGLKGRWATIPAPARRWCDQVAKASGTGSYVILGSCIEQETAAGEQNQRRQFRR